MWRQHPKNTDVAWLEIIVDEAGGVDVLDAKEDLNDDVGMAPTLDCNCDDPALSDMQHPCAGFGTLTRCGDRSKDFQHLLVCRTCLNQYGTKPPDLLWWLVKNFGRRLRHEMQVKIKAPEDEAVQEELRHTLDEVRGWFEGKQSIFQDGKYPDGYANDTIRNFIQAGHPHIPSTDACHRHTTMNDVESINHTLENVVLTRTVVNRAKYTHLAGHVQIIAELYRMTRDEEIWPLKHAAEDAARVGAMSAEEKKLCL
ncbi:hypothetical protein M409DRAFT_16128 [Zasmidium cellare ATCC 36951]|uniref:Uncharacterized protein n=1 Tax=Zasmidium cellare ATCC 36951 TaxID=1080233 RepID=A0A6A6D613_ZASCE|nr:uncharacterized protein M409DRAFT_16128 [Zasmidium cellare ATCC 36951]KAF2173858.1 hypothetical protein M409DRAFT_16128 [Zasmidium cellare ATCC 36951]